MPDGTIREFVAFDFETTGLSYACDRIVEVGAVRFDASGRELGRFQCLVDPGMPMPPGARAIHGIDDAELVGAPKAEEILPALVAFLGDPAAVAPMAHHATFDAGFLGRELTRAGLPLPAHGVVDTLALARARLPNAPDHRLETLARVLELDPDGPHRALPDSLRVKDLFLRLGGPDALGSAVAFPVFDPIAHAAPPRGWDDLLEAIARGRTVRIEYAGGTRGQGPRDITPRRFVHRGGAVYLVAFCHIDQFDKEFRLDRVRNRAVLAG